MAVHFHSLVLLAIASAADHVHVIPLVPEAAAILKKILKGGIGGFNLSSTDGAKPNHFRSNY